MTIGTMNPKVFEKALFEAAVAIDDRSLRGEFLDQACNGDTARRARLGKLVAAYEVSDDFFEEAEEARTMMAAEACRNLTAIPDGDDGEMAHHLTDAGEGPGSWIGRYKVIERIGEGGCGVVYLAEQKEPVQRLVALKVIRLGMDTESVIARFEMERQSLAVMDHPNIAHVLDAGATEGGRPYFVMEWVRGVKITDFCRENLLPIRERIDLFIDVCHAIQHAHQKGVIHRDIKPSNILVSLHDGKPTPKVIDFGIAKATSGKSTGDTLLTASENFVGTPAYMSPEQADRKGLDVDTRSDVYSLGILLYELLVGRTPFDPKELSAAGMSETRRILLECEPPFPSAMLASLDPETRGQIAIRRRTDPARLISSVKGDLDWVVMKAIEKDRQRRYDTVNGFVMDLQRYIENEPVLACPPSRVYLVRKFVRRNRIVVGSTAGIAAALVLGLGLAYGSFLRERDARQEQARLRGIAEAARANEERLRELSAARENIAQVAVLLSEGKTEEADAMLQHTPLSTIEPSLEAANVLRSLGGWNAMRDRWSQAAECFMLLTQANQVSRPDKIVSNTDLVASGPALVRHGNLTDYNRFRRWTLSRFADTTESLAAEQVIQSTLLLPADRDFLRDLQPLGELLEKSMTANDDGFRDPAWAMEFRGWRAWALSLLNYRRGDYERAAHWGRIAADCGSSKKALYAAIHPVLAMAEYRQGDLETAGAELEKARVLIDAAFTPELPPAYEPLGPKEGFWWDWVQGRILLQEAEALIGPPARE
jgi:eukaryotic-like serine/threonine-protein kinase